MLRRTEGERGARAQVEIVDRLQGVDHPFRRRVRTGAFQPFHEQGRADIAFQGSEARTFVRKVFLAQLMIFQDDAGARINRRNHLRDDDVFGVLWAELLQPLRQRLAADEGDVSKDEITIGVLDLPPSPACTFPP